jgi:hypothetical protein
MAMRIFEVIGIGVLCVIGGLLAIFVRRELISRAGGTIDMSMRLSTFVPGRGWAPGLGRFSGDELRWYRLFSLGFRPRRVLVRDRLVIEERRSLEGPERLAMPEGWIVVRCAGRAASHGAPNGHNGASPMSVEFALAASAYTGFQSWVESAPPGALRHN